MEVGKAYEGGHGCNEENSRDGLREVRQMAGMEQVEGKLKRFVG